MNSFTGVFLLRDFNFRWCGSFWKFGFGGRKIFVGPYDLFGFGFGFEQSGNGLVALVVDLLVDFLNFSSFSPSTGSSHQS
jgi:hypothetical protein